MMMELGESLDSRSDIFYNNNICFYTNVLFLFQGVTGACSQCLGIVAYRLVGRVVQILIASYKPR